MNRFFWTVLLLTAGSGLVAFGIIPINLAGMARDLFVGYCAMLMITAAIAAIRGA